jgi:hypothetical protein
MQLSARQWITTLIPTLTLTLITTVRMAE